tara:strand:+ start:116 stop:427 length:312 start_codon:yes stop_codon:yes gene_type:complete
MREQPTIKSSAETYKHIKKKLRTILKALGAKNIKFSNGFFRFSGFATFEKTIIYVSCSDTRESGDPIILIRSASDYKDYTGGMNNFTPLDENRIKHIIKQINK